MLIVTAISLPPRNRFVKYEGLSNEADVIAVMQAESPLQAFAPSADGEPLTLLWEGWEDGRLPVLPGSWILLGPGGCMPITAEEFATQFQIVPE